MITSPQDFDQYVTKLADGTFRCEICYEVMKSSGNLKSHVESKHFPNVFSYQCHVCNVTLGTKKALYRHRQRNKDCQIASVLWNAEIKIRWTFSTAWIIAGSLRAPEDFIQYVLRNGDGSHSCTLCEHKQKLMFDVRNHVESKHFPNTFTYSCEFCAMSFGTRSAYLGHKKKFHRHHQK